MASPIAITDSSFDNDVIKSKLPVLVDFWAEWCGPCKMIAPTLEELAEEYSESLVIAKLDVDNIPQTASSYGIRGIPALLIFKDGKPVDQIVGAVPKSVIKSRIDQII